MDDYDPEIKQNLEYLAVSGTTVMSSIKVVLNHFGVYCLLNKSILKNK